MKNTYFYIGNKKGKPTRPANELVKLGVGKDFFSGKR